MSGGGQAVLAIEGELTIYRAAELCEELKAAQASAAELEINLAGVTEMDSAGVQLLMAAKKSAQVTQRTLRLVGHSPAVLEVFEILDLAAHFGDPLVMPAAAH
ncbi:MAG TPA: STAS domain-containing protein [Ideonella sp.]|uniref:STAS domain-containing protein n=1 Tax=Ideonella sp. TaxID=1929293 RepID=UPI002CBF946E|nr:STAS domain-containing protein [Ideonella sp.]HSI47483.1 STAS domain-containing protein [Ideonella sp.]